MRNVFETDRPGKFRSAKPWITITGGVYLLCTLLSACSSPQVAPVVAKNDADYAVRVSSVEALLQHGLLSGQEENPLGISVSYVKPVEKGTILLWHDSSSLRISLLGNDHEIVKDEALPDTFIGKPIAVSETEDGLTILSSAEDDFFHTQYYISKVSTDFKPLIPSICLSDLCDSTVYGYESIGKCAVISADTGMFFYDHQADFSLLGKMVTELPVFDLTISNDKLYALQCRERSEENTVEVQLSEIDTSSFRAANTKTIFSGTEYADRIFGEKEGFEDTIAFAFSDGLYLYSLDGSSLRKEFDCSFMGTGLTVGNLSEIYQTGKSSFTAWGLFNTNLADQPLMMDISRLDNSKKETLQVGILSRESSPEIYNICAYVNTLNLPFSLDVTVYRDPSDPDFTMQEFTAGRLEFLRDAISDNPPDLLILSPDERELFASQDALLDLTPYISSSDSFKPDEMLPNVWSSLTPDGSCNWITPYVYLNGSLVTEEAAAGLKGGDTEDIRSYMKAHPDATILSGGITGAFQNALLNQIANLPDGGEYTSEDKEAITDLIRCMVEMNAQARATQGAGAKDVYSTFHAITSLDSYYQIMRMYSTPRLARGDFGRMDKGPYIMTNGGLSISAGSDQPDLCWEASEFLLSEEIMDVFNDNIPLRISSFETMILHNSVRMNKQSNTEVQIYNGSELQEQYSIEIDAALLAQFREAVNSAETILSIDYELNALIDEDLTACLEGDATPEETADRLIERVRIYTAEWENPNT